MLTSDKFFEPQYLAERWRHAISFEDHSNHARDFHDALPTEIKTIFIESDMEYSPADIMYLFSEVNNVAHLRWRVQLHDARIREQAISAKEQDADLRPRTKRRASPLG